MNKKILSMMFLLFSGASLYSQPDNAWKYPTVGCAVLTGVGAAGTIYNMMRLIQRNAILDQASLSVEDAQLLLKHIENSEKWLKIFAAITTMGGVGILGSSFFASNGATTPKAPEGNQGSGSEVEDNSHKLEEQYL